MTMRARLLTAASAIALTFGLWAEPTLAVSDQDLLEDQKTTGDVLNYCIVYDAHLF
jgi:hypothetical protein